MKQLPLLTKQIMTFENVDPIHDHDHLFGNKLQVSNELELEQKGQQIGSLTSDVINHEKYPFPKHFTVPKDTQTMKKTLKVNKSEIIDPNWHDKSFSKVDREVNQRIS